MWKVFAFAFSVIISSNRRWLCARLEHTHTKTRLGLKTHYRRSTIQWHNHCRHNRLYTKRTNNARISSLRSVYLSFCRFIIAIIKLGPLKLVYYFVDSHFISVSRISGTSTHIMTVCFWSIPIPFYVFSLSDVRWRSHSSEFI